LQRVSTYYEPAKAFSGDMVPLYTANSARG